MCILVVMHFNLINEEVTHTGMGQDCLKFTLGFGSQAFVSHEDVLYNDFW